ncbi:MAG: hypothetical protein OEW00_03395 [candidate division Zixibacteria bacterium]|nr:hypothetical protein [candidate division Zixibacteria bacterium]
MTAKEVRFKCLMCGHEYTGMYDHDNVTERSCPKCRSNSVRRLPDRKPAEKK